MEEFLQHTKSVLIKSNELPSVHVVLGDRECGLDSTVSALVYAYFLYKTHPADYLYVPVLNIQRSEFPLRSEVVYILQQLNISESSLTCRDDIDLHTLNKEGKLALTLVDHNRLTSYDKALDTAIVKIIDHHEQGHIHCEIIQEPVGSCITLIVSEILQVAPELLNQQLTHLLRGVIILDCMNMTAEAGKMTIKDKEIITALEQRFPDFTSHQDVFDALLQAKLDVSGLSTEQILLKDLKELLEGDAKLAISTVYMTLEDFLSRPNLIEDFKMFIGRHGYDILVLLTIFFGEGGEETRQLAIYTDNDEVCSRIGNAIAECQNPCLQLDPIEYGFQEIRAYQQGSSSDSCKQILPIIKECIHRRQQGMVMDRRTSSTEAVNGSAPASEGSSGVLDLSGPDVDSQNTEYIDDNLLENSQNMNSSLQAHGNGNVELMSPDSGLATIRSNRSSKESSVFLSDESPIREAVVPPANISHGYDLFGSLPEGELLERNVPSVANLNNNFDLSVLDPMHCNNTQADFSGNSEEFMITGLPNLDSTPQTKYFVKPTPLSNISPEFTTDILKKVSQITEVLKVEDSHAYRQENARDKPEKDQMMPRVVDTYLTSQNLSDNVIGVEILEEKVPPTPMNSLEEGSPLDESPHNIFAEDVIEKMNEIVIVDSDWSDSKRIGQQNEYEIDLNMAITSPEAAWDRNQKSLSAHLQSFDLWTDIEQEKFNQSAFVHGDARNEIDIQYKQSIAKNNDIWNTAAQSIFQSSAKLEAYSELDKNQLKETHTSGFSNSESHCNKTLLADKSMLLTNLSRDKNKQYCVDDQDTDAQQNQITSAPENTFPWDKPIQRVITPDEMLPEITKKSEEKIQQTDTKNLDFGTESTQMPIKCDSSQQVHFPIADEVIHAWTVFNQETRNVTSESKKIDVAGNDQNYQITPQRHDVNTGPAIEKENLISRNSEEILHIHNQPMETNFEEWNISQDDPKQSPLANPNLWSDQISSIDHAGTDEKSEFEQDVVLTMFDTHVPGIEHMQEVHQSKISHCQAIFEAIEILNTEGCKLTAAGSSAVLTDIELSGHTTSDSLEKSGEHNEGIGQESAEFLNKVKGSVQQIRHSATEKPCEANPRMKESRELSSGMHQLCNILEQPQCESICKNQSVFNQMQEISQPKADSSLCQGYKMEDRLPDYEHNELFSSVGLELVKTDNEQTLETPRMWNQFQQEVAELEGKNSDLPCISGEKLSCLNLEGKWKESTQKATKPVFNLGEADQGRLLPQSETLPAHLADIDVKNQLLKEGKLQTMKNSEHCSDFEFIQPYTNLEILNIVEQGQPTFVNPNKLLENEQNQPLDEIHDIWIDPGYEFPELLLGKNDVRNRSEQELIEADIPDIVNDYCQNKSLASSAIPDLWDNSSKFFGSAAVNPDILNVYKLESTHSASNSPDRSSESVEVEKQDSVSSDARVDSEQKHKEVTRFPALMDPSGQPCSPSISGDHSLNEHNELIQHVSHKPLIAVDSKINVYTESGQYFNTVEQRSSESKDLKVLNNVNFESLQDLRPISICPDAWIQLGEGSETNMKEDHLQGEHREVIRYYDLEDNEFTRNINYVMIQENMKDRSDWNLGEEVSICTPGALPCSWTESEQCQNSGSENNASCHVTKKETESLTLDDTRTSFHEEKSVLKENLLTLAKNMHSGNNKEKEIEPFFSKSRSDEKYFISDLGSQVIPSHNLEAMDYFSVSEENLLHMEPLKDVSLAVTVDSSLHETFSSADSTASKTTNNEFVHREKIEFCDEDPLYMRSEVQACNSNSRLDVFEVNTAFVHENLDIISPTSVSAYVGQTDSLTNTIEDVKDSNVVPPLDGISALSVTEIAKQRHFETECSTHNVESTWVSFENTENSSNSNVTSSSLSSSIHKSDIWEDLSPEDGGIVDAEETSHSLVLEGIAASDRIKGSELRIEIAEFCNRGNYPILEQSFDDQYSFLVSSVTSPAAPVSCSLTEVEYLPKHHTNVIPNELPGKEIGLTSNKDCSATEIDYITLSGKEKPCEKAVDMQVNKSLMVEDTVPTHVKTDIQEDVLLAFPSDTVQHVLTEHESSDFENCFGETLSTYNTSNDQFVTDNDQDGGKGKLDEKLIENEQSKREVDASDPLDASSDASSSKTEMSLSDSENSVRELKTAGLPSDETCRKNSEEPEIEHDAECPKSLGAKQANHSKNIVHTGNLSSAEIESTVSSQFLQDDKILLNDLEGVKGADQANSESSGNDPKKEQALAKTSESTEISLIAFVPEQSPLNSELMAQKTAHDHFKERTEQFPSEENARSVTEDVGMDIPFDEGALSPLAEDSRPAPPNSLDLNGTHPGKKKLIAPEISLSLDQSEESVLSDDNLDSPEDLDINVDDLETPDEADSLEYSGQGNELEWEDETPCAINMEREVAEPIPEYTAEEERTDNRLWRTVVIGEQEHRIDMKTIEPYRKVVSHGGYYSDGLNAIIVFAACYLPESSRPDYNYIMENLFLYVISTLELLVAEDYMIIYLNGATPRRKMPGFNWMKKCYQMIDRRLRKNLKSFIIVHPSWFIRTILAVTRPFISSKFSSKIRYVSSLGELEELIPMQHVQIPDTIRKYEEEKCIKRRMRLDEELKETSDTSKAESTLDKPME